MARMSRPREGRAGCSKAALALALACLAAGAALAQESAGEAPARRPAALILSEGIGYEAETGQPGALVLREAASARAGRFAAAADLASSIATSAESSGSVFESAGLRASYRLAGLRVGDIELGPRLRYRRLFEGARELRYGATFAVGGDDGGDENGFSYLMAFGFEEVRTVIDAVPIVLVAGNPLVSLDAAWRFSQRFAAEAGIEGFSDEDATLFPRTMFVMGGRLDTGALALKLRLVVKYTDFPTPTGYVDGYALRASASLELGREGR